MHTMARLRTVTIDDRDPFGEWDLTEESLRTAYVAAGHVTKALGALATPLTGRRAYMAADLTGSDRAMKAGLSDMTLSTEPSAPSYLSQMIDAIKGMAFEDTTEFERILAGVDQRSFRRELPVRKSRAIREAKLIHTIVVDSGVGYTLAVSHANGRSLYVVPHDEASPTIAMGIARSIYVDDSGPSFEVRGKFKPAPSFDTAGRRCVIPDAFFLTNHVSRAASRRCDAHDRSGATLVGGAARVNDAVRAMNPAHPRFATHFTHPIYDDPADEWSPFGSDGAAGVLAEWESRRDELTSSTRLREMYDTDEEWRESAAAIGTSPLDAVDEATWVVARAFTLLRLTGQIDEGGKVAALRGLDRLLLETDGADEYLQQKRDLQSWRSGRS